MVKLVGRVVPLPPDAPANVHGWRAFDVRSAHYHSEQRRRIPFTTRWYLPDGPRWAKMRTPPAGTLLQLAGRLLGRHEHKYSTELFVPLAVQVEGIDYPHNRPIGSGGETSSSPSTSPRSAWGRARAVPPAILHSTTARETKGDTSDNTDPFVSEKAKGKRKATTPPLDNKKGQSSTDHPSISSHIPQDSPSFSSKRSRRQSRPVREQESSDTIQVESTPDMDIDN